MDLSEGIPTMWAVETGGLAAEGFHPFLKMKDTFSSEPLCQVTIPYNFNCAVLFRIVEAEWPQCRRCQALSCWGSGSLEWVGWLGEGRGNWGQSKSNLISGRTVPVTAGGRQVSEKGVWERRRGNNGGKRGSGRKKERATPCIYVTIVCALRMIEN